MCMRLTSELMGYYLFPWIDMNSLKKISYGSWFKVSYLSSSCLSMDTPCRPASFIALWKLTRGEFLFVFRDLHWLFISYPLFLSRIEYDSLKVRNYCLKFLYSLLKCSLNWMWLLEIWHCDSMLIPYCIAMIDSMFLVRHFVLTLRTLMILAIQNTKALHMKVLQAQCFKRTFKPA